MNKEGSLKLQEMAFVLLAIALLGALIFIFFVKFQSVSIQEKADLLNQERALSLRDKIATISELKCSRINCVDKDKARLLLEHDVSDLFQGLKSAKLVTIYPEREEMLLYDSGKEVGMSYSSFVNLCEQKKIGSVFEYDCALALLLVGI